MFTKHARGYYWAGLKIIAWFSNETQVQRCATHDALFKSCCYSSEALSFRSNVKTHVRHLVRGKLGPTGLLPSALKELTTNWGEIGEWGGAGNTLHPHPFLNLMEEIPCQDTRIPSWTCH